MGGAKRAVVTGVQPHEDWRWVMRIRVCAYAVLCCGGGKCTVNVEVTLCICSLVRTYAMLDACIAATDQEGYLSCQNHLQRVRFKIGFTLVYRTYRLVYSLCDIFPLLCLLFQELVPPNTPGRQRSPPSFFAYGHGTSPEYSCGLDVPCGSAQVLRELSETLYI